MSNREQEMVASRLSGGPADRSMTWGVRAARIMGWASFGLAAAFVAAPNRIARTFGLEGKENLIRAFGAYPEGIAFAVLLMNICVPLIDMKTQPTVFGHRGGGR